MTLFVKILAIGENDGRRGRYSGGDDVAGWISISSALPHQIGIAASPDNITPLSRVFAAARCCARLSAYQHNISAAPFSALIAQQHGASKASATGIKALAKAEQRPQHRWRNFHRRANAGSAQRGSLRAYHALHAISRWTLRRRAAHALALQRRSICAHAARSARRTSRCRSRRAQRTRAYLALPHAIHVEWPPSLSLALAL